MTKADRHWPAYIAGRFRTSTVALIVAFLLVWWLYDINQPDEQEPAQAPSTFVVPPGFDPNPNYTWVPRTDVQGPRTTAPATTTPTTTETTTPTESTTPTDETSPGSPPTSATTTTLAPPGAPPATPAPTASR